jgi:hypothetical protein
VRSCAHVALHSAPDPPHPAAGSAAGAGSRSIARRARPDLVERLERLDRVERPEPAAQRSPAVTPAATETRAAPRGGSRAPHEGGTRRARGPAPTEPVDINRASEPELLRLPGVSPALAARIVAARPFADIDELRRVPGLRRGLLERLRPLVAPLP